MEAGFYENKITGVIHMDITVKELTKMFVQLQDTQKIYLVENGEYFHLGKVEVDSEGDVTIQIGSGV